LRQIELAVEIGAGGELAGTGGPAASRQEAFQQSLDKTWSRLDVQLDQILTGVRVRTWAWSIFNASR
jgi:hypothetical protein